MFHKQSTKIRKSGDQGFTLIEVLIALSIFSIGILAVANLQISSTNHTTSARKHTEAVTWAGDLIEFLTVLDYDDGNLDAGTHQIIEGIYTIDWNVTDSSPLNNAKTINVSITYGAFGGQRSISLDFIKAR